MNTGRFCSLFFLAGLLQLANGVLVYGSTTVPAKPEQSTASSDAPDSLTIPGPLRSFLRMAGLSQNVAPPEVLPLLARNVLLHGYEMGRSTEYLILVRRYVQQAEDLSALAGTNSTIRVSGCNDADRLLHTLGYRVQGECGRADMSLVTADPEHAFLTIDSGFPLVDLEDALRQNREFVLPYAGSRVPILFTQEAWKTLATTAGEKHTDLLQVLLYEPEPTRLYWGLSRMDPATRLGLRKELGLAKLLPYAAALDLYGSQVCVRDGGVVVPGGQNAEKEWRDLVGVSPRSPWQFIPDLLKKDHGWLGAYFDAMARTSQEQQEHFASGQRFKRYYDAFRTGAGTSSDATARMVFRPAPELMVLTARMQWDHAGEPYVPGSLRTWSDILMQQKDSKPIHDWSKRSRGWRSPDQLAEAMFALTRWETQDGPVQMYLCLSELDQRRGLQRRLNDQTVSLMAQKFADFSDQYRLFTEFPQLNDDSITKFLNKAEAINKISDGGLRGNAMGIFQANIGLWQIFARQGQIERSRLNPSWQAMLDPFTRFANGAQLLSAGRVSLEGVLTATGSTNFSQDHVIDLLAGVKQSDPDGKQIHAEMATRILSVLEDQRLVSIDTLFALDDGLKDPPKTSGGRDQLVALAGELKEFEMPRPIFTASERTRWAPGVYNNRHAETQLRVDVSKIVASPSSPPQREKARGELASFLRDSLVGMNYAYYEPPGSQILHHNSLFVRSHDFSGETVVGIQHLWQDAELFGAGSPAGGGAHLVGSLADLPYVLAEAEQDFISPSHVQALIWQQLVPEVLSNAMVPRWWNVSRNEMHAVALYQRAGEGLLVASAKDSQLRIEVLSIMADRMSPQRRALLDQALGAGDTTAILDGVMPADSFYLAAEFRQKFPGKIETVTAAGKELQALSQKDPDDVNWNRLSNDFGNIHPVFADTYARELLNVKPFPALGGVNSRLMGECWDSGNLYWARLADEMGYSPVILNRIVPELTRQMVEKIFASDVDDWPAVLRALHETGAEFRDRKLALRTDAAAAEN
jgi:hypothetical protein